MTTVAKLEDWFTNTLDLSMVVSNVVFDGTNSTLAVDNLLHLRPKMEVSISGTDYLVDSVDRAAGTFTVADNDLTGTTTSTIEPLYFVWGKPLLELPKLNEVKASTKYPMVFLSEVLTERFQGVLSRIDREADIELYLLDESSVGWTTAEHYAKTVDGLYALAERVRRDLRKRQCCFSQENEIITQENRTNWGTFQDLKGNVARIFNDNVSGINMSFTLNVYKNC